MADITVGNTICRENEGIKGGAIYFENGSPVVEDCLFDRNVGSGAIYVFGGNPTLRRLTIIR